MDTPTQEWLAYAQFVQELIGGGTVRRNRFTQWELDLLLDLHLSRLRKSTRPEVLRRYLRVVQQSQFSGAEEPLRLADFLAGEVSKRAAVSGSA